MKIQYASDLHLEFSDNSRYLKEHPLEVAGDVLILAGDIGYLGDNNYTKHPFWDWAADNYRQVIVVPGNHEFYKGFDLDLLHDGWIYSIRPNICCHYNDVIQLEDIDLIVSTLWAQIRLENAFATEFAISDFRRIQAGGKTIDWVRFNEEHTRCLHFLKKSIEKSTAKHIIVATHHVPSYILTSSEFTGSKLNGAFVSELSDLIAASPIEYWIYGHSHRNIDSCIGKTRCICNQLGYVAANEHHTFDKGKIIVI